MQPLKVLLITSEFPPNVGGIGNHAYNLALHLQENDYKVTVLADIIDVNENDWQYFINQQPFTIEPVFRRKNILATYAERIKKAKQLALKNDIVITSGKFSLWLNFLFKNKKLAIVHGSELCLPQQWAKNLVNKALKHCNHIVAVSNFTAKKIDASIVPLVPITVIHNGIQLQEFNRATPNNAVVAGNPALITVGSVTNRKGQENVINALPEILKVYPNAHYHIVGKPVIKEQLLTKAKALGVANDISFWDEVERKRLLELLAQADVKLMLSNYTNDGDFEGFGIGIIEANAFGKPAIGSDNCGIVDAIDNHKTGILVNNKNTQEIATALQEIITNYNEYSNEAYQWAQQHSWTIIIKQYIQIINSL